MYKYGLWRAGTSNRVFLPIPPGWESIPGHPKRFTNTGCDPVYVTSRTLSEGETTFPKKLKQDAKTYEHSVRKVIVILDMVNVNIVEKFTVHKSKGNKTYL